MDISAGDPVYFLGTDPILRVTLVGKADSSDGNKMKAIGIAQGDILNNTQGNVTVFGGVKRLDTSNIDGATGLDDSGRILYVKPGGGLTLDSPLEPNIRQPIGVLFVEDGTVGEIFVNHPEILLELPSLSENYIWIGVTGDVATAHRLNTDSFQKYVAGDGEFEIALADEIKFGGYEFTWDGDSIRSKVQTNIASSDVADGFLSPVVVDSFSINYRSAKFFVQISSDGPTPNFQVTELLIVHNGTIASLVDYGTASTLNQRMGDFTAEVDQVNSLVNIYFQNYAETQGDLQIKVVRTSVIS